MEENVPAIDAIGDLPLRLVRPHLRDGRAREESSPYGIGFGEGKGDAWQIDAAQRGRGIGALMSEPLPWVAAVPPVIQVPVKVPMSGYGVAKPSESVCRKATTSSSSVGVKPRCPTV